MVQHIKHAKRAAIKHACQLLTESVMADGAGIKKARHLELVLRKEWICAAWILLAAVKLSRYAYKVLHLVPLNMHSLLSTPYA